MPGLRVQPGDNKSGRYSQRHYYDTQGAAEGVDHLFRMTGDRIPKQLLSGERFQRNRKVGGQKERLN